ncbi:morphogenic membrane protein MmpA [Streptomyces sp. NPDC002758]
MTMHRSPKSARPVHPAQPVERAVTASLIVAVLAGIAWIGGMLYAVTTGL